MRTKLNNSQEHETEKRAKAQQIAKELHALMNVTPEEWVKDTRATRHKGRNSDKEMQ